MHITSRKNHARFDVKFTFGSSKLIFSKELVIASRNAYTPRANPTATAGKPGILHLAGLVFQYEGHEKGANMTKITFEKPDYKHWATLDSWGINAFALLINGICPTKYRAVRLAYLDIPPGFEKAKKTFTLLDSIPWAKRYEKLYTPGKGGHPVIFIHEAINKDLHMPVMLRKAMENRYQRYKPILPVLENQMPIIKKSDDVIQKQLLANRERRTYTKAVGLFVLIIKELKEKLSRNSDIKLSALQVAQLLIDKAENLNIEIDGLKSFDRKITEAMEFIMQETNSEISL